MSNPTTIDGVLVALLAADTGITDIVGTRIKPYANTVGTTGPYLTYFRITTTRDRTNDGPTGQAIVHYQLDCWAAEALTVRNLANTVRLALDGYRANPFLGWKIDFVFIENESDGANEPVAPGQSIPIQRVTLDVTISVAETVNF